MTDMKPRLAQPRPASPKTENVSDRFPLKSYDADFQSRFTRLAQRLVLITQGRYILRAFPESDPQNLEIVDARSDSPIWTSRGLGTFALGAWINGYERCLADSYTDRGKRL